jgi:four helix bundle protein
VDGFRDLAVYRQSVRLSHDARRSVLAWESLDRWTVGVQLIRAGDSIGANIAEALGRAGSRDRMRMLFIARGSAYELEHWLDLATARGLQTPAEASERARDVSRMINGLIRSWRRQTGRLTTDD